MVQVCVPAIGGLCDTYLSLEYKGSMKRNVLPGKSRLLIMAIENVRMFSMALVGLTSKSETSSENAFIRHEKQFDSPIGRLRLQILEVDKFNPKCT